VNLACIRLCTLFLGFVALLLCSITAVHAASTDTVRRVDVTAIPAHMPCCPGESKANLNTCSQSCLVVEPAVPPTPILLMTQPLLFDSILFYPTGMVRGPDAPPPRVPYARA
jgi:hypothetical protein